MMIEQMKQHCLLWSLNIGIRDLKETYNNCTTFGKYTLFPIYFVYMMLCIALGTITILVAEIIDKLFIVHIMRAWRFAFKGLYGLFFKL